MSNLVDKGAASVSSPKDMADKADHIVTMLPNNDIVRAVYTGSDGILNGDLANGSLLIDSSTIDPAVSKEMAAACAEKGSAFVDAPVSGGQLTEP